MIQLIRFFSQDHLIPRKPFRTHAELKGFVWSSVSAYISRWSFQGMAIAMAVTIRPVGTFDSSLGHLWSRWESLRYDPTRPSGGGPNLVQLLRTDQLAVESPNMYRMNCGPVRWSWYLPKKQVELKRKHSIPSFKVETFATFFVRFRFHSTFVWRCTRNTGKSLSPGKIFLGSSVR